MASGFQALSKRFPTVVVIIALIAAGWGALAFFWAFRSCPLDLEAGTLLTYRLRTELRRDPEHPEDVLVDEQDVDLYCLNGRNDVALLARDGAHEELRLLRLQPDGRAHPYRGDTLQSDLGHAIGFFDFNLLPLPQEAHQSWSVDLVYGYLPPGHQAVQGRVRRVRNGPNPEFELRLDTVEWVAHEPYEHFRSISDFVCRYRYRAARRVVDQAHICCRYGLEGRAAARYVDVTIDLTLTASNRSERPLAVRDLALAAARAQAGQDLDEELRANLRHLAAAVADHPRLSALARRLAGTTESLAEAGGDWFVQVASVRPQRRPQAEEVARVLQGQGFAAVLQESDGRLLILVGPFRQRREAVLERLRSLCGEDAFWLRRP